MNFIIDAPARAAAVNPLASVCVSAPAGSGKTELLIQRYLGLLGRVQRPEQVLAITFTRKAAAEMRERVIQALHNAMAKTPCETTHQQTTRALADLALAANERHEWRLLHHIARFNIKTIDSFCAGLTRQMPVLSQFGGQASVQDDVTPLYEEAVQNLFKLLDDNHPVAADLEQLLLHFDNNWEQLQALLVTMLARREQWRGYVGVHYQAQESEDYLVATVATLVTDALDELSLLLRPYNSQLLELLVFAVANLNETVPAEFPGTAPKELALWNRIRSLLLTKQGDWRKTITKKDGFPADSKASKQRKSQLKELIDEVSKIDGLQVMLQALAALPTVGTHSTSWQLVLRLSRLLPTLAAQLLLVFQEHGVVDHSQISQSALMALGDDDTPTDLALRLDYQIEHILVDEFQDTAITQYELLHKLTRGWGEHNQHNPQAPRTMMIVGDGMQSIYGFRGANVGLFLKARREGFNGITPEHLKLLCNFRSDQGVVNWVNETFTQAFPTQSDVYRSQVKYSPATATRPQGKEPPVEMHGFHGDDARTQEVNFICEQIIECAAGGSDSIAILGRSRSHLQPVITQLKALQISYNAPELDSLANSSVITDLLSLCRALSSDADRLAWMSVLRAPWCGLQLCDLLCISQFSENGAFTPLWSTIQQTTLHDALSADGKSRLRQILPILREARAKRDRLSLRVWIEQAWVGLSGPQCVPDAESLLDAEHFLQLLEIAETEGVGLDMDWLSLRLKRAYMNPGDPVSKVHLLTLHKAKGLEFDRVVIPQLDRLPNSDGREILLWDEHSDARGDRAFLLAADDHSAADEPTLYNYLRLQKRQKSQFEATRLLYVGATRAISKLLLTASIRLDAKTEEPRLPSRRSLLRPVWPTFRQQMILHVQRTSLEPTENNRARTVTRLLRNEDAPAVPSRSPDADPAASRLEVAPVRFMERCVGTAVHKALEELSWRPLLPVDITEEDRRRWQMALQREGLHGEVLDTALDGVLHSVAQTLKEDGDGRWVLANEHREARSEWPLTTIDQGNRVRDIVIDRCFIDAKTGVRWIIDYKNSRPAQGEKLAAFLASEGVAYSDQLSRYRDAVREISNEPLRCALFFTTFGYLHIMTELDLPARENATK